LGHGAPRELASEDEVERSLDPELHTKLTTALDRLDSLEASFKAGRAEELYSQTVKAWGRTSVQMSSDLGRVCKTLLISHQLNLDAGIDGGGQSAKPWVEELSGKAKFDRLVFKLEADGTISGTTAGRAIVKGTPADVSYAWLEAAVVEWIVTSVEFRPVPSAAIPAAPAAPVTGPSRRR
jgi:hypothetical protein